MPTSQWKQISSIIGEVIKQNPKTVLDIGIGFGKYGVLCREYLETRDNKQVYPGTRRRRIDGIEIYPGYLTPLHEEIYDNIFIGNALDFVPEIDYDLILLIDVLEHFNQNDGSRILEKFRKNSKILISVPKRIGSQGEAYGNIHETHITPWNREMLKQFGGCTFIADTQSYIAILENER